MRKKGKNETKMSTRDTICPQIFKFSTRNVAVEYNQREKNALINDSVTCPPKQYVGINCLRYLFDFIFRFVFKIKIQFCVVSKRGPVTGGVPPQPAITESTALLAQLSDERSDPFRPVLSQGNKIDAWKIFHNRPL